MTTATDEDRRHNQRRSSFWRETCHSESIEICLICTAGEATHVFVALGIGRHRGGSDRRGPISSHLDPASEVHRRTDRRRLRGSLLLLRSSRTLPTLAAGGRRENNREAGEGAEDHTAAARDAEKAGRIIATFSGSKRDGSEPRRATNRCELAAMVAASPILAGLRRGFAMAYAARLSASCPRRIIRWATTKLRCWSVCDAAIPRPHASSTIDTPRASIGSSCTRSVPVAKPMPKTFCRKLFMTLAEAIPFFRGQSSLFTFACAIAHRKTLSFIRTRARRGELMKDHSIEAVRSIIEPPMLLLMRRPNGSYAKRIEWPTDPGSDHARILNCQSSPRISQRRR